MKKTTFCSLLSITLFLALSSCKIPGLCAVMLELKNNSDQKIKYLTPIKVDTSFISLSSHPDTTLRWCLNPPNKEVLPRETVTCAFYTYESFEYIYDEYYSDTLSVFIFSSNLVDSLPWDSIVDNYLVLQRYDLSVNDANMGRLVFPPDSTMKHIHMWPPYGTYDENGQIRIKQQPLK